MPFVYPDTPHVRMHGPRGYEAYQSYKDWLRDEFTFRCVYCLERERWYPNGHAAFGVDHVKPKPIVGGHVAGRLNGQAGEIDAGGACGVRHRFE